MLSSSKPHGLARWHCDLGKGCTLNDLLFADCWVYCANAECYRPMDALLEGYDMVLQSAEQEGQDITNAFMASAPNLTFWLEVGRTLQEAAPRALSVRDKAHAILAGTGPQLLLRVFQKFVGLPEQPGKVVGEWNISEAHIRVYGILDWFVPCHWNDATCHKHIDHLAKHEPDSLPRLLVGHHHNAATWLKPIKAENRQRTLRAIAVAIVVCGALGLVAWWRYKRAGSRPTTPVKARLKTSPSLKHWA